MMTPSPKLPDEKHASTSDGNSPNDELSHPPFHIQNEHIASADESTTSSDEDNNNTNQHSLTNVNGYCLLPQDADATLQQNQFDVNGDDDDNGDDDEFLRFATHRVQSSEEHDQSRKIDEYPNDFLVESVWSSQLESEAFPVDDDKANYIKTLMASIQLPASSVPSWAQHCSEQDWQQKLLERIACRQTTFFLQNNKLP